MEEKISISKSDYEELINDVRFLDCLRSAGVDNWDGYDCAIEMYLEKYPED